MSVVGGLAQASIFAQQLAYAAAEEIRPRFRVPLEIDDKSDFSPVTEADRKSEAVMRKMINENYPAHGIIGEEYGKENEDAEFVWVIDPIDGTKSFIAGVPLFGTLIALLHENKPVLGIIYQPVSDEMWIGGKGIPTTLNGKRVSTRAPRALSKATLMCTDSSMFASEDLSKFESLKSAVKLTRWSTDCYGYALLATGAVDIVCEADLKLYDFAALVPVIENAGGVMTDWRGGKLDAASDGHILAASCERVHAEALKALGA